MQAALALKMVIVLTIFILSNMLGIHSLPWDNTLLCIMQPFGLHSRIVQVQTSCRVLGSAHFRLMIAVHPAHQRFLHIPCWATLSHSLPLQLCKLRVSMSELILHLTDQLQHPCDETSC